MSICIETYTVIQLRIPPQSCCLRHTHACADTVNKVTEVVYNVCFRGFPQYLSKFLFTNKTKTYRRNVSRYSYTSKINVVFNLVTGSSVLFHSALAANLVKGAGDVEVDGEVGVALPDEQAHSPLLLLLKVDSPSVNP